MVHTSVGLSFLDRWRLSADLMGIQPEAYNPEARVINDKSGKSEFTFGAILNVYRDSRPSDPSQNKANCPLCGAVENTISQEGVVLDTISSDFIVTPNKFPAMEGHSMAITVGTAKAETPMYTTGNMNSLPEQMSRVFRYAQMEGLEAFHNSQGAGASIPNHEHWHLTNWSDTYRRAGDVYGFAAAKLKATSAGDKGKIPSFPFAHLVFTQPDTEGIVSFLRNLEREIGPNYDIGTVPHIIAQRPGMILVAPYKVAVAKGSIGSGDVAGHIFFKSREDYEKADYDFCLDKLGKQLFRREEINLESML